MVSGVVHTDKCYCDIPRPWLGYLITQHYVHKIATPDLIAQLESPEQKEWAAVVALLDVPREDLVNHLKLEAPEKMPHWLACHENIRTQMAEEGLKL